MRVSLKLPHCGLVAGLTVALALAGAGRASASAELEKQVSSVAVKIRQFLDSRGAKEIAIGQFVGAPQLAANPGPGLALLLARELNKHKIAIKLKGAKYGLNGEFREVSDDKDRALWLELKLHIVDRKNRPQQVLSCPLFDPADIAWLLGANTRLPDETNPKGRLVKLREDLDNPPVVLRGARTSVGPDEPYAVEILAGNSPRRPTNEDGAPYVRINRGEIYAIRLINNTAQEAAVELTIDGVNVFAFNQDPDKNGKVRGNHKVILGPRSATVIRGWYRAKGMSDSFQVTSYPRSAAFLKASTATVGNITASFRRCWEEKSPELLDMELGGSKDSVKSGTGFGPRIPERYRSVRRLFGEVGAVITVRYAKE